MYLPLCLCIALNEKLDKRASKKEAPKCGFKKKLRIVKSPSKLTCPCEAPAWAIVQPFDESSTSSTSITAITDSTSNYSKNSDSYDSDSD